jgi:CheY-like chemotaxis protein
MLVTALSPCTVASNTADPLDEVHAGHLSSFRIHQPPPSKQPYLDVRLKPVIANDGTVLHSVAIVQNVTAEVEQQKKLDALHQAGRDLANLEAEHLAEMNIPTRIEMLKQNLLRYVHNLLHYETIEVRLLDANGELTPLVAEGMTDEAKNRRLFRAEFGNGVTGHVAYTGNSYLCPDASKDPHYLEGAKGAKSSLTIPLKYDDIVIGTLNVESPRVNGFGTDDLQFTELLSKELATALHTLDLLSAQQTCTLDASIEAVNKEIALPVDEVLGSAALLYARLHGSDPEAGKVLRRIMEQARSVKDCVNKVHRSMMPQECFTSPDSLAGKRVLVIEQVEQHRRTIHLMLRRMGVEVETVTDPLEGLALCTGTAYDAIFLEIKPRNMRGSEAFFKFRLAEPDARISLTTGFGYDECHTKPTVAAHGLTAVLFKPFKIDQVMKALTAPVPPPLVEPVAV